MPLGYVPTAVNRMAAFVLPVDGDTLNVASVNTLALKYLMDTTAYVNGLLAPAIAQGTATALLVPAAAAAALYREVESSPFIAASGWAANYDDGTLDAYAYTTTASGPQAIFPVPWDVAYHGTIVQIDFLVQAASAHVGLPAVMPQFELVAVGSGLSGSSLASGFDASPDVATFEGSHTVSLTGLSVGITGARYYLRITPESGANSLAGFRFYAASIGVTAP